MRGHGFDGDSWGSADNSILLNTLNADGQIRLPDGVVFLRADFTHSGSDLLIETPDGNHFVVPDFFMSETPPALTTHDGAVLSPELVMALAGPQVQGMVAQESPVMHPDLGAPIGQVSEAEGSVTVTHPNGEQETLLTGGQVFQGDVVQTASAANVSIIFVDDTVFSLDEDGRMVLDEMVYDPDTQTGVFNAEVVHGVFSFVSGHVAKTSPDGMVISTPVATIGIRGSTGLIDLGNGKYALVDDVNGTVGELTITNGMGTVTLNTAGASTVVNSFNQAPTSVVVLTDAEIQQTFGTTLTKLVQVVAKQAQTKAADATQKAQDAKANADVAKDEASKAEADAAKDEADAKAATDKADEALAKAEDGDDPEALAKAKAQKAEADKLETAAADAKVAAQAKAVEAATKAADADVAQQQADQAQQFSSMADTAFTSQSQAFEQFQQNPPDAPPPGAPPGNGPANTADIANTADTLNDEPPPDGPPPGDLLPGDPLLGDPLLGDPLLGDFFGDPLGDPLFDPTLPPPPDGFLPPPPDPNLPPPDDAPPPPPTNAAPRVDAQTLEVIEDTLTNGFVTGTDAEGSTVTYSLGTNASHGTVSVSPNGDFSYDPNPNFFGADSFVVRADDGAGGITNAPIHINVTNVNDAPVSGSSNSGSMLLGDTFILQNSHLNATDVDNANAGLIYTVGTVPTTGSVQLNSVTLATGETFTQADVGAGNVRYVHSGANTTPVNFTYTVTDGTATIAEQTFTMTIGTTVTGTAGADTLTGTNFAITYDGLGGNDTITAGSANDTITGGPGNDTIDGGSGNDIINGGAGTDTATFASVMTNYTLSLALDGTLTVTDTVGANGVDTLTNVEALQFTNGTITVGTEAAEFQVNTVTQNTQTYPKIAALTDGGYVVVWNSNLQDGSGYGIYSQQYNAVGNAVGAETQVNSSTANNQLNPSITGLENGGYIVTWTSSNEDIHSQRYSAGGSALGGETVVNTTTTGAQRFADISDLTDGGYVIVWQSNGQDSSLMGVYFQRYDASGTTIGSEVLANTSTLNGQEQADITGLSNGGFVVTWHSSHGATRDVFSQRYDSNGNTVGGETQINTTTALLQGSTEVAALSNGGYVVTWESQQGNGTYDMYSQRYDLNNNPVGTETLINTYTTASQHYSKVTALSDGKYVVTWSSSGQDGSDYGIYMQMFDANGNKVGTETLANTSTADRQIYPDVAGLEGGGFIITWSSTAQDGDLGGIYAQRYDELGNAVSRATLQGTAGGDTINIAADQTGLIVDLGAGADTLNLAGGTYNMVGAVNVETITALGSSNDTLLLTTASGGTSVDLGDGTDVINLASTQNNTLTAVNVEEIYGGHLNDTITLTSAITNGIIKLGLGTDTLNLANATNTLQVDGIETINGGTGTDTLQSANGIDLQGSTLSGIEVLNFDTDNAGVSYLEVNSATSLGALTINGGTDNNDIIYVDAGSTFNATNLTLNNIAAIQGAYNANENITGSAGNDTIMGMSGVDTLNGGAGNDTITGGAGNDTINGGSGTDTATLSGAMANYTLGFAADGTLTMTDTVGGDGTDTLTNVETLGFTDGSITVANQAGERLVNTTTSGDQTLSKTTWMNDGGSIVSWYDNTTAQVFMQRYDAAGTAIGGETQLTSSALSDSSYGIEAFDNGGYGVAWVNSGIPYVNLYNASGTQVGTTITAAAGSVNRVSITQTNDNGFLATYDAPEAAGLGIYGRFFDSTGTALTAPFSINSSLNSDQYSAITTSLDNGSVVVSWVSRHVDGTNKGVYARVVKFDGTSHQFVTSELTVEDSPSLWEQGQSVAALDNGGFVIAWHSGTSIAAGTTFSIFAQRYDSSGTAVGSKISVGSINSITAYDTTAITALEHGGFVITWTNEVTSGDFNIHGQIYNASGVAVGSSFLVNTTTASTQTQSNVAASPDGGFIVSWSSADAGGYGIYSQRFDATGNKLGYTQLTGDAANNTFNIAVGKSIISIDGLVGSDTVNLAGTSADTNVVKIAGIETITGGAANDIVLLANTISNTLTIDLGAGIDTVKLANGGNTNTFSNVEQIIGGTGNDVITLATTLAGTDEAFFEGGLGTDTLNLANGGNVVEEIIGFENINGGTGTDVISSPWSVDLRGVTLNSIETINIDTNNDAQSALYLNNTTSFTTSTTVYGSAAANDVIGSDNGMNLTNLVVGTGIASISLDWGANDTTVLTVDANTLASAGALTISGNGTNDSITLSGTGTFDFSNDTFTAIAAINGDASVQTITGSAGNDVIRGGGGGDTLLGGAGADVFKYTAINDGGVSGDSILDFTKGTDKLHFDAATFNSTTTAGNPLNLGDFSISVTAIEGVYFIFNTTNSTLYYDPDGVPGGSTGIAIAVLDDDANPATAFALAASDIVMV